MFHLYQWCFKALCKQSGIAERIVHPNYKIKVSREIVKLVNFITATRRTDKKEFNGKRYIKI